MKKFSILIERTEMARLKRKRVTNLVDDEESNNNEGPIINIAYCVRF